MWEQKEEQMGLTTEKKRELVQTYGENEVDTGSVPVQIALLTARVKELTAHLNVHKKDFSAQRGLRKMVGQRRRLLKYLKRQDFQAYKELIQKLGIRGV